MWTRPSVTVLPLLVLLSVNQVQAQIPQPPDAQPSDYDAVIALIFRAPRPQAWEKQIKLQFLYDPLGESQIDIRRPVEGALLDQFQVERWWLPEDSAPVFQQLERMAAERPRPTNEEMARRIKIRRELRLIDPTIPLGQLAEEAYSQLRIPFVRAAPMTLHSPVLLAEVWTSGTRLTIEMDEPADTWRIGTPDNALIAWMRRVRQEVERSWASLPAPK